MCNNKKKYSPLGDIIFLLCALFLLVCVTRCEPKAAATEIIPSAAKQHRATLVRTAQYVWGLDAPVATFAAQIHQESRWNANAKSPVGAQGIAQFMPTTTQWIASVYPNYLAGPQPYNPGWAMRALVQYDLWIYNRLPVTAKCDRWAMVMSSYNGGLGWVNRDRKLAASKGANSLLWFNSVELFNAGRSDSNIRENRHYPRNILFKWEPLYVQAGWGRGVCEGFTL